MSSLASLSGILGMVGRPMTVSRDGVSVQAHGYLRHGAYAPLTGSTQAHEATFVFMADGLLKSPLGELRKFDRIADDVKIYVVQTARVLNEGTSAVLIKGTCSNA